MKIIQTNMTSNGFHYPNGSFSYAMGQLQRKELDSLNEYYTITLARSKAFMFSFPISLEKTVVLVRRLTPFKVRFDNLNANIDANVYGATLLALGVLLIIFLIQELLFSLESERHSLWKFILLAFPGTCMQP